MALRRKILLPSILARPAWDAIASRPDLEAVPYEFNGPTATFHALLADAHAVGLSLTPFGPAELLAAPHLQVVARNGVGYDNVDVPALTRRRIPLMVTGDANSPSVAEHALFFMLALAKRGAAFDALVREGNWARRLEHLPGDLFGKCALIIGFGRIGRRLALALLALQMRVLVVDPYKSATEIRAAGCEPVTPLEAALPEADFVSVHCPRNSETQGLLDARRLGLMRPSAFLINTARGGIVDEAALHAALSHGALAGAGLDVLDLEPPSRAHPLLGLSNVLFAPHMAGVTRESFDRMAETVARNIIDTLDGRPARSHVVNPEVLGPPAHA